MLTPIFDLLCSIKNTPNKLVMCRGCEKKGRIQIWTLPSDIIDLECMECGSEILRDGKDVQGED